MGSRFQYQRTISSSVEIGFCVRPQKDDLADLRDEFVCGVSSNYPVIGLPKIGGFLPEVVM